MKTILITGASKGIGFELVKLFDSEEFSVIAISRKIDSLSSLQQKNLTFFSVDITNHEDLQQVKNYLQNESIKIDAVIHNAGLLINKPFLELTSTDFYNVYNTNVFSIVSLTQLIIPFLNKNAHIVNISSMGGVQGSMKFAGLTAYSSSKGALITLTEVLAEEFKDKNISFNVLALGAVQTEMLEEAFPGYKAPVSALEMASYIQNFTLTGHNFYNGKLLQVSLSTP